jgi:hypothetical protein
MERVEGLKDNELFPDALALGAFAKLKKASARIVMPMIDFNLCWIIFIGSFL